MGGRHRGGRDGLGVEFTMPAFCRDCLADTPESAKKCACGSRRIVAHAELAALTIAHLDCDAFYAAIEKRDNPSLEAKPLIVGGGKRGVVTTCCYIARTFGVKSAMPMFKALKLCPDATVISPRMSVYAGVAREVRRLMAELTPLVEPLSLDEAYLDLAGTERLHGMSPAKSMARLASRIERGLGITASVGLSYNKFLAKLASDMDKPRGFAVIGRAEAKPFLRDRPVSMLRGAGEATVARLARDGITKIGQLQDARAKELGARYGEMGLWLYRLANADDTRVVDADAEMKSISAETTFESDISDVAELEDILWEESERVSARAKAAGAGGRTVVLKLKTAKFQLKTRSASLPDPTQLADVIFRTARTALRQEADGTPYRLLGVGLHQIRPESECDPPDLVDTGAKHRAAAERAIDRLRAKFGKRAVQKGRSLR